MVATDARENHIFLHILITPCFRQYKNVLIYFLCLSGGSRPFLSPGSALIPDDFPAVHGDDPFVHLRNHLLTVGYYDHRCSPLVDLIQKVHDLMGIEAVQVSVFYTHLGSYPINVYRPHLSFAMADSSM